MAAEIVEPRLPGANLSCEVDLRTLDQRRKSRSLHLSSMALLLFGISALSAQTLDPLPGFVQDVSAQYPLPKAWSLELETQLGTQGNATDLNPFAYSHGLQSRLWFHYDGVRHTTLTAGTAYISYFTVPESSYYRHPEWRFTVMDTLKQALPGGSLYEQIRGELLNFRDNHGAVQHLPRVRFRFGQNLHLGEGGSRLSKPYIGLYQEAIVQFPKPAYSHVAFVSARFFAGSGFRVGSRAEVLLGLKAEAEVSSSGSTVTLFYGPAFSVEYNFRKISINERHTRTTSFRDF